MPTRSTTMLILTIAAMVGLGTTVFTVVTTEPAEIPTIDQVDAATGLIRSDPHRSENWGRLLSALAEKGDLLEQAQLWLAARNPQWVADEGAEALLWYWISDWTARTTERYNPDFTRPESMAARAKAIDLLIELSLRTPANMRHWHWNSLGWAGARSGRLDLARGALERTEESLRALPDDFPVDDLHAALIRLSNCWADGVGDKEQAAAVLRRAVDLIENRGEGGRDGVSYVWLARRLHSLGDDEGAESVIAIAEERYAQLAEEEDARSHWRAALGALREIDAAPERIERAVDALASEVASHGQGRDLSWNEIGWEYEYIDRPERAQEAWRRWFDEQAQLVESRPTATNLYNLACAYALLRDADGAITALQRAIDEGWRDSRLATDRDFTAIRSDPRFEQIIRASMEAFYDRTLGNER